MKTFATCCCSAVLGALLTVWLIDRPLQPQATAQSRTDARGPGFALQAEPETAAVPKNVFLPGGLSAEEAINVAVYETNNRSVVNITTKATQTTGLFLLEIPAEGSGSGTVIDRAGHILTNFHVVEEANEVNVTLYNGKSYEAKFVGADAINDIAVIKIDAPQDVLFPVTFGDSSELKVGMKVYAIGNPFGLERTMTTGIISSLNRSLQIRGNRTIKSIIQIDAAVNPGNSGGPLLDAHGRQIGINTAIASRNGQSAGVGFSIPMNLVARVVPELIRLGRVIRPEIGIQRVYKADDGLLIAQLTPGGPAERAGLKGPALVRTRRGPFTVEKLDRSVADLIVEVDGEKVESADDFLGFIESKKVGQSVDLTIVREGRRIKVPVVLGGEDPRPASQK